MSLMIMKLKMTNLRYVVLLGTLPTPHAIIGCWINRDDIIWLTTINYEDCLLMFWNRSQVTKIVVGQCEDYLSL